VYSDIDGPVYKVERSNYATENGYDLESGIQVTEPEALLPKHCLEELGLVG